MKEAAESPETRVPQLEQALRKLDRVEARRLFIGYGGPAGGLAGVEDLIVPALERLGWGWEEGTVSLSQVYMAARVCESLVEDILPPADPGRRRLPPLAVAVLEDYHLLGARIVLSVLKGAGYEPLDYGRTTVEQLLVRLRADLPAVLLVSVLMLPAALRVKELSSGLRSAGLSTKLIVGGAPFRLDPELAAEVGADAAGKSAADAIRLVHRFLEERP